jgi:hypothetical protein
VTLPGIKLRSDSPQQDLVTLLGSITPSYTSTSIILPWTQRSLGPLENQRLQTLIPPLLFEKEGAVGRKYHDLLDCSLLINLHQELIGHIGGVALRIKQLAVRSDRLVSLEDEEASKRNKGQKRPSQAGDAGGQEGTKRCSKGGSAP